MPKIADLLKLMRPNQWIKNGFVFTGLIFGHGWGDVALVENVVLVALAFCLVSSSVYVLNDVLDRESDRAHPKKRNRPVAARRVSVPIALILSFALALLSLAIAGGVSLKACGVLAAYAALNVLYSLRLKHVVILDVFCIATGFMLRILAGTVGVGIPPSQWLLLCGLMVTLFLGFAKRRAELVALTGEKQLEHRRVLATYGSQILEEMMTVCAAAAILTYSLYTMSGETVEMHGTRSLIYTVPFVIYGLFRYMFLLYQCEGGGDPSREIFTDVHMVGSFVGWFSITLWMIS